MASRIPIFLFGVGGHARSTFEVVYRQGLYEVAVVLDDEASPGSQFRGVDVRGGRKIFPELAADGPTTGIVAVGDNAAREAIALEARGAGLSFVAAVDPSAQVARDVPIGAGSVVMPSVVLNWGVRVGEHAILNTACTVDHDCEVADFAHVSPGAHISGECELGRACHVGIGANVIQRTRIGEGATVGAGATVIDDVPDGGVAAGVPARPIRSAAVD